LTSLDTARRVIELAREKKGKQIVLMDVKDISSFTDFFVVVSGDSTLQIKAICDHIEDELRKEAVYPYSKEGYENLNWVLLDYVDVVVHVFDNDTRGFYGLERLWADAKMEFITEEVA